MITTALRTERTGPVPLTGPAERERVLRLLRAEAPALRAQGLRKLSLFGSIARGEAGPTSDVDLLGELDPSAGMSLLGLLAVERGLAQRLGRQVEILTAPDKMSPRMSRRVAADRVIVF